MTPGYLDFVPHDLFISHASEDKAGFVEPLVAVLRDRGLSVWYDRFELRLGDDLRKRIDEGLRECRFGVVVLSPAFLGKHWPEAELSAMFALEGDGRKRILPVRHRLTHAELTRHAPLLAGRLNAGDEAGLRMVAEAIVEAVRTTDEGEPDRRLVRWHEVEAALGEAHRQVGVGAAQCQPLTSQKPIVWNLAFGNSPDGLDRVEQMYADVWRTHSGRVAVERVRSGLDALDLLLVDAASEGGIPRSQLAAVAQNIAEINRRLFERLHILAEHLEPELQGVRELQIGTLCGAVLIPLTQDLLVRETDGIREICRRLALVEELLWQFGAEVQEHDRLTDRLAPRP